MGPGCPGGGAFRFEGAAARPDGPPARDRGTAPRRRPGGHLVQETASLLTQIEVFEDIPLFGAATGALLNLVVAHRADLTARHLFQERWLRDNGKVDEIEPATVARQDSFLGTAGQGRWLAPARASFTASASERRFRCTS